MRWRVTWNGKVEKTVSIESPADALYHVWSRYREGFSGGEIRVAVERGGAGVKLAQLSFPVTIEREVEAADAADAMRSFLYDDRVPGLVHMEDVRIVPVPELVAAAAATVPQAVAAE